VAGSTGAPGFCPGILRSVATRRAGSGSSAAAIRRTVFPPVRPALGMGETRVTGGAIPAGVAPGTEFVASPARRRDWESPVQGRVLPSSGMRVVGMTRMAIPGGGPGALGRMTAGTLALGRLGSRPAVLFPVGPVLPMRITSMAHGTVSRRPSPGSRAVTTGALRCSDREGARPVLGCFRPSRGMGVECMAIVAAPLVFGSALEVGTMATRCAALHPSELTDPLPVPSRLEPPGRVRVLGVAGGTSPAFVELLGIFSVARVRASRSPITGTCRSPVDSRLRPPLEMGIVGVAIGAIPCSPARGPMAGNAARRGFRGRWTVLAGQAPTLGVGIVGVTAGAPAGSAGDERILIMTRGSAQEGTIVPHETPVAAAIDPALGMRIGPMTGSTTRPGPTSVEVFSVAGSARLESPGFTA